MTLADIARIRIDPRGILESRWVHDTAHAVLAARRRALASRPEAGRGAADTEVRSGRALGLTPLRRALPRKRP